MVKTLKAFGVVAGIVSFLFCTSAGLQTINLENAPEWVTGLGVFFIGIAFFAGPLVIIVSLNAPDSAAQPIKTKQLKKTTTRPQTKSTSKPAAKSAAKPPAEPATPRIYVGNLSPEASETDIKTAFSGFGDIKEVRVIKDRAGKSKGYAFIEMLEMPDAKNAIESLNGKDLGGRILKVNLAKTKPDGSRRPRRPSNSRPPREPRKDAQMVDWDA